MVLHQIVEAISADGGPVAGHGHGKNAARGVELYLVGGGRLFLQLCRRQQLFGVVVLGLARLGGRSGLWLALDGRRRDRRGGSFGRGWLRRSRLRRLFVALATAQKNGHSEHSCRGQTCDSRLLCHVFSETI